MIKMLLFLPTLTLLLILSDCSIRPQENTKYVVVGTGDPVQVAANEDGKTTKVVVTGTTLKGGAVAKQDISGWITMPPGHWSVISAQLEKDKAEGRLITFPQPTPK